MGAASLLVDRSGDREVLATWLPQVGDWVRVEPSPECRASHSFCSAEGPLYGRVEAIDREHDDPDAWVAEARRDRERRPDDPTWADDDDARQDAASERGHWYLVQDSLDGPKIAYVDGQYAAAEMTRVEPHEALPAIVAAHRYMASLSPGERLWRALTGAGRR